MKRIMQAGFSVLYGSVVLSGHPYFINTWLIGEACGVILLQSLDSCIKQLFTGSRNIFVWQLNTCQYIVVACLDLEILVWEPKVKGVILNPLYLAFPLSVAILDRSVGHLEAARATHTILHVDGSTFFKDFCKVKAKDRECNSEVGDVALSIYSIIGYLLSSSYNINIMPCIFHSL